MQVKARFLILLLRKARRSPEYVKVLFQTAIPAYRKGESEDVRTRFKSWIKTRDRSCEY
ncbi:hypothetical protein HanLR1_Chr13g0486881 [Helianthus annuus]|nr:hypothetical protein HanLR1_Chr13g0486881 [Helianthus annuus]